MEDPPKKRKERHYVYFSVGFPSEPTEKCTLKTDHPIYIDSSRGT